VGFLRRLFGETVSDVQPTDPGPGASDDAEWRQSAEATFDATADRQRVSLWVRLLDPEFENMREQQRLFELENRLMRALDQTGAGEHDTNSLERGFLVIRMVGEDAEAVVSTITPLLGSVPSGSYLAVRRGQAGTGEERVDLGEHGGPA
jgi:hypothetical protein